MVALLLALLLPLLAAGPAGAQPKPWVSVTERGLRTAVVEWAPARAVATLPASVKRRRAPLTMVLQVMNAGRYGTVRVVGESERRVVLPWLPISTELLVRARACRAHRCVTWKKLRFQDVFPFLGSAVRPASLNALPALGLMDIQNADKDVFAADGGDADALGLDIVRVTYWWDDIQPSSGAFDWSHWGTVANDAAIARAETAHRKVLVTVHGPAPDWAVDPTEPGRAPRLDAWRAYVDQLVQRHPGAAYWEVWNEPNSNVDAIVYPYRQLQMAAVVRDVLRARGAAGKVVMALGTGKITPFGPADQVAQWGEFLRYGAQYGFAERPFDLISFHPYNREHDVTTVPQGAYGPKRYGTGDIGRVLSIIDAAFPGQDVPLGITEFSFVTEGGRVSPALSPEGQGVAVCEMLTELRRWNRAGRIPFALWYELIDEPGDSGWRSGLRFADGSVKPAYLAWQAYVTSPPAGAVSCGA